MNTKTNSIEGDGSSSVHCSQSAIRPTAAECKQAWDWLKNLAMEENQHALHVLLEWEYQRREAKRLTEELEYIGNSGLSARHLSDLANKAVSSAEHPSAGNPARTKQQ